MFHTTQNTQNFMICFKTVVSTSLVYHIRYNGIQKNLKMIFANITADLRLDICFNMDGLPLFNSSTYQFWPILAGFFGFPWIKPFVVSIWCGQGKPSVNEYLKKFVHELKSILENGVEIKNHIIRIGIKGFFLDTPARAYIKGVYN